MDTIFTIFFFSHTLGIHIFAPIWFGLVEDKTNRKFGTFTSKH
jgi:hypothetical protein